MTLKEMLEQVWSRPGVINPCHRNMWKWATVDYWWEGKIGPQEKTAVCVKGSRVPLKKSKRRN